MSKIFQYLGYAVYIYSNDHFPVHVHIRFAGKESKFELVYVNEELKAIRVIKIKSKPSLNQKDIKEGVNFIKTYHHAITEKFIEIIQNRNPVKVTVITKRVK